jgi:hypothetical protein
MINIYMSSFCFYPSQDELDQTADIWDSHIIRPSRNENVPHGRPNVMYTVPELYAAQDYQINVCQEDINNCKEECTFRKSIACDEDLFHLCCEIMGQQNLPLPNDPYKALDLYIDLRRHIKNLL